MSAAIDSTQAFSPRFVWAGYLVGLALGGFFDGIVLHQILQWHHLLSTLDDGSLRDLRMQIVADGLFHLAMYLVGAVGLGMLYRSRGEFTGARADRRLIAAVLIGFAAWHVLDAVLDHWLLGIHRIRMDVANPLAWDLGWLLLFGLPPLAIGLWLRRRHPRTPDAGGSSGGGVAAGLAALLLGTGAIGGLGPAGEGEDTVTVVLRPDVQAGGFLAALGGSDARVLWSDRSGGVWILSADDATSRLDLYRRGALYVSGTVLRAGCAAWLRG